MSRSVERFRASPQESNGTLRSLLGKARRHGGGVEAPNFDGIMETVEDEEVQEMKTTMVEWWQKQAREEGFSPA